MSNMGKAAAVAYMTPAAYPVPSKAYMRPLPQIYSGNFTSAVTSLISIQRRDKRGQLETGRLRGSVRF